MPVHDNAIKTILTPGARWKLEEAARATNHARYRVRSLWVLKSADNLSQAETERQLGCSPATVGKARRRFAAEGPAGIIDRREDNGLVKADEAYGVTLYRVLRGRPRGFGLTRPTWTKRLLIAVMRRLATFRRDGLRTPRSMPLT